MIEIFLKNKTKEAIKELYNQDVEYNLIQIQETRKDFQGDLTIVVFPFLRFSKNTPEQTGTDLGNYLKKNFDAIADFNVIKGFLNLIISEAWWLEYLRRFSLPGDFGSGDTGIESKTILVEYSSPNTNKPLHLGHIRNNLLGFSLYRILTACGHNVIKTNIVNDRGIHICKSMLAWMKYGNGESPESSGMKGDHLVGKYYVIFERELKLQVKDIISKGVDEEKAINEAPLMQEARRMLLKWEAGDKETVDLWRTMNSWVYAGFDVTYKALGVDFDKIYYESETFKTGKEIVFKGLEDGLLYRKDDSSVWVDLTDEGLDHKVLLRSDGTAVYMTQDIGTAVERYNDYHFDQTIYVVGNEQNYHFQVLSALLKRIGYKWAEGLHHFSYGMVELPEGRMKSREGKVVDADDLIKEMIDAAREVSNELGKLENYNDNEKEDIYRKIGLGALKYFILKVDPKKNMTFNPAESIDFNGNTGPFVQYTYARIKSVQKKAEQTGIVIEKDLSLNITITSKELGLIKSIRGFEGTVREAGSCSNPSLIANYIYDLARDYNQFYHDLSILGEPDTNIRNFRLLLTGVVGNIIFRSMWLLGIEMPERM
jgi:arginyl-tRNA synthetase